MRLKKKIAIKILAVLLIYIFIAGNTSGELALCIGADGHIALEPVIHEHCENHPHIEQDESSSMMHEHDGHTENPHCKPCIDIPIFIGPTDNRLPLKPVKPNPDIFFCLLPTEVITYNSFIPPTIPRGDFSHTDENRFLRSIILIV
ncbi:MAG: hypothetical protein ACYSTT_20215 [Planctomycetota bacterium]|jgi:hypothetical protein